MRPSRRRPWRGCASLLALAAALLVVLAVAGVLAGVPADDSGTTPAGTAPGRTLVAALDIGQGLAVAVITPEGRSLLFDAGNGASDVERVIVPFFRERGIERLDYLVVSHPHQDHVGGMPEVLERMPVGTWVDPVIPTTNQAYLRALETVDREGIRTLRARRGVTLDLGPSVTAEILWPGDTFITDDDGEVSDNENSVVLRITHGEVRFLLTGDIEREAEDTLLELDPGALRVDVLQVAHHGSNSSSAARFLDAARPGIALISAGEDNPYGHPHREVLKRLRERGITVYRTDRDGTVVVVSDGRGYQVGTDGAVP